MQMLPHMFARAVTLAQLLLNPLIRRETKPEIRGVRPQDREKDVMEYVLLSAIVLLIPGALIFAVSLLTRALSLSPFMPLARRRSQRTTVSS